MQSSAPSGDRPNETFGTTVRSRTASSTEDPRTRSRTDEYTSYSSAVTNSSRVGCRKRGQPERRLEQLHRRTSMAAGTDRTSRVIAYTRNLHLRAGASRPRGLPPDGQFDPGPL